MAKFSALIAIQQAIGVLLWSFLNASILQWRARKLRSWLIKYKDAYLVSIKASLAALVIGDVVVYSMGFISNASELLLSGVGALFGLTSWWVAHSRGLLKLADPPNLLSPKHARAITTSVFAHLIAALLALSVALLLLIGLVSLI